MCSKMFYTTKLYADGGEAFQKQGLALMGQAKVTNIKYGLFAELNKIQDQVVRDKAYYCSCKEALFYGKTYYPKQCIQPLGKIFCFMLAWSSSFKLWVPREFILLWCIPFTLRTR